MSDLRDLEPRLKIRLFRLFLWVATVFCGLLVLREMVFGSKGQLPFDLGLLALTLVGHGALKRFGYQRVTVGTCYGLTVVLILALHHLGYHAESHFYLVVLALVVLLAVSALFLGDIHWLLGLVVLESAFLAVHMGGIILAGQLTTGFLTLDQQLFVPVVSFILFTVVTLLTRRYVDKLVAEYGEIALERQDRHLSLGSLIRGLAHHLNTPLGNAKVLLSVLPAEAATAAWDGEVLGLLRSSVDISVALVGRMSEFLRQTEQSDGSLLAAPSLVEALTHATLVPAQVTSSEAFQRFYAKPRTHLWESIRFLVGQLVDNARLHSRVPGVVPTIELDVDDRRHLILKIGSPGSFTGPEVLAKGRQPFFSTLSSADHPGLGLYFADYIAQHVLTGHLEWTSDEARGTVVTVRIPRELPSSH